jgi:spore coat protein A, manganese oxidase
MSPLLIHTCRRCRRRASEAAMRPVIELIERRVLFAVVPLLDPMTQPRFINPLPLPAVAQPVEPGGNTYEIGVTQFQQDLGLKDPVTGAPMLTTVWGYNGSYPGPTILANVGQPINVKWTNNLVDDSGKVLPHLLPVDASIHHAYTGTNYTYEENGVPIVTHLHGGHSEAASDGLPDQWFTPSFQIKGEDWAKETLTYANDQDAATLWYHDHAIGVTRLNVNAGLAGFYLLRDPAQDAALNLPSGKYELGLAIQDRMFTADGQLYWPNSLDEFYTPDEIVEMNPDVPQTNSILPEFMGDHILVNGEAWPYHEVEPRKYRFRLLNGSDSRVYSLGLSSGTTITQIGGDQGYLPAPVKLTKLTIAPGERADVIIDFAGLDGQTVIVTNHAKVPFPSGDPANPRTVGKIMAFRVGQTVTQPDAPIPATLNTIRTPAQTGPTRKLALFEMEDEFGRLLPQLGNVQDGAMMFHDPSTENIRLGDTEVWEVYNNTGDTHPIHLHLVKFRVLSRQKFTATVDEETGAMTKIKLNGAPRGPAANEAGWKDTVQMNPGEVTRIIATFDKPGEYVWHCHILSHEEHDMMRPLTVLAAPAEPLAGQLLNSTALWTANRTSASFGNTLIDDQAEERVLLI